MRLEETSAVDVGAKEALSRRYDDLMMVTLSISIRMAKNWAH
jgi:hypothetical protein